MPVCLHGHYTICRRKGDSYDIYFEVDIIRRGQWYSPNLGEFQLALYDSNHTLFDMSNTEMVTLIVSTTLKR